MAFKSVLVLSDNEAIIKSFIEIIQNNPELSDNRTFRFACYLLNNALKNQQIADYVVEPLDIKQNYADVIKNHDLVISAHCKQIFPAELIRKVKCINIHPGYNPHNRGWYPQVFSILNGKPLGATIHEIDEELDHGKIIDREAVEVLISDTSLEAYNRVQQKEIELMKRSLPQILNDNYQTFAPEEEGNINFKKDFNALREIKLDEQVSYREAIDRLRALTHPPFRNGYFVDPETGDKIWIQIILERDMEEKADEQKT